MIRIAGRIRNSNPSLTPKTSTTVSSSFKHRIRKNRRSVGQFNLRYISCGNYPRQPLLQRPNSSQVTKSIINGSIHYQQHLFQTCCDNSFTPYNNIRFKSTKASHNNSTSSSSLDKEITSELKRICSLRNVGVFAHVDAGKTTVTERMLALAGIVHKAGSVDTGNTVTDYLPAERERGITIQSAAISFNWNCHNNQSFVSSSNNNINNNSSSDILVTGLNDGCLVSNDEVTIQLIDTPGHVDFSVEVNRSVAVLDGAVLVIDAVAGVQAQTETVWRAMTNPKSMNHHPTGLEDKSHHDNSYSHEPLPCIAFINKMDKEGCNFAYALSTLKHKLSYANPVAIQIPLYQVGGTDAVNGNEVGANVIAVPEDDLVMNSVSNGHFVGVIDLIEMRAIIWPNVDSSNVSVVEECVPNIIDLLNDDDEVISVESQVTTAALQARSNLIAALADVDEQMEEYFLMEEIPSKDELRSAIRRSTLSRRILPVMTGAALRGKGVEPLLDAVADFLPSPIERLPPRLIDQDKKGSCEVNLQKKAKKKPKSSNESSDLIPFGHSLHPSLLALAFKVVHMKNKGSGDGRVVFARIYSGKLSTKDTLKVVTPSVFGDVPEKPRTERVGGMLELSGGLFSNLQDGVCFSGNVCALVGLKSVVTGDTLLLASEQTSNKNKKKKGVNSNFNMDIGSNVCLAGVASPKPVLTVRVEAESTEQQSRLSDALRLLTAEDPSLLVEETDSVTLLSGLGELHIEVIIDRLKREFGLPVWIGKPAVAYRETVNGLIETGGLSDYDNTIGVTRLQASIDLQIETIAALDARNTDSASMVLSDPIVTLGPKVREYLQLDLDAPEEELVIRCDKANALISGCLGALKRGPVGSFGMANVKCNVVNIDSEGGLAYLNTLPGALRAASSSIVSSILSDYKSTCTLLEPTMSVEINAPTDMVGTILSDLTGRRGTVGEVFMGDDNERQSSLHAKALIHGEVPLVEILGCVYGHASFPSNLNSSSHFFLFKKYVAIFLAMQVHYEVLLVERASLLRNILVTQHVRVDDDRSSNPKNSNFIILFHLNNRP